MPAAVSAAHLDVDKPTLASKHEIRSWLGSKASRLGRYQPAQRGQQPADARRLPPPPTLAPGPPRVLTAPAAGAGAGAGGGARGSWPAAAGAPWEQGAGPPPAPPPPGLAAEADRGQLEQLDALRRELAGLRTEAERGQLEQLDALRRELAGLRAECHAMSGNRSKLLGMLRTQQLGGAIPVEIIEAAGSDVGGLFYADGLPFGTAHDEHASILHDVDTDCAAAGKGLPAASALAQADDPRQGLFSGLWRDCGCQPRGGHLAPTSATSPAWNPGPPRAPAPAPSWAAAPGAASPFAREARMEAPGGGPGGGGDAGAPQVNDTGAGVWPMMEVAMPPSGRTLLPPDFRVLPLPE